MAIGGLQDDIHGHLVMSLSPNQNVGCVQNLTIGAAAVQSLQFTPVIQYKGDSDRGLVIPGPLGTTHIRVCSTVDCYIMIGNAPFTLTSANGMLLPALSPEYFPVDPLDYLWVIQSTTGGTLNIVECE